MAMVLLPTSVTHAAFVKFNIIKMTCNCKKDGGIEGNVKIPVKPVKLSKKAKKIMSWVFIIIVCVESVFLYLQAIKGFRTKSAEDVDRTAFFILLVTNVFWMLYALIILQGDLAIFVSGTLYVIGSSLILTTSYLYG